MKNVSRAIGPDIVIVGAVSTAILIEIRLRVQNGGFWNDSSHHNIFFFVVIEDEFFGIVSGAAIPFH